MEILTKRLSIKFRPRKVILYMYWPLAVAVLDGIVFRFIVWEANTYMAHATSARRLLEGMSALALAFLFWLVFWPCLMRLERELRVDWRSGLKGVNEHERNHERTD